MANQLSEQVTTIWKKSSAAQKVTVIALSLAVVIIAVVLVTWSQKPSYAVAFSDLSDSDASAIIDQLNSQGITYQLKGTGTILVPSDKVYSTRLSMASAGLPQSSTVGYEIFDSNTLGMTEFVQQVNYQRALEGELEKTIGSLNAIEAVKVNVVTPEKSLLTTDQSPTTASVMIKVKPGDSLDSGQVKAITHLVAFSVEGLDPSNVVVVDSNGNLLTNGSGNGTEALVSASDSQRAAEAAAAEQIRQKVQSMLDTILGPNRSTVQANVIMDWSQKEVTSSVYDPTPVLISSEKVYEGSNDPGTTASGIPGVASNVAATPQASATPSATSTATTSKSGSYVQISETNNYQLSQTQTHEVYSSGQIKSISLAVMVDKVDDQNQLSMIKSAVAAAAGIDETRGDTISVNTIEFDRSYYETQATAMEKDTKTALYEKIGIGVGAGVLLIILLAYFSKVMKNIRTASKAAWKPIQMPVSSISADQISASRRRSADGSQSQPAAPEPAPKIDLKPVVAAATTNKAYMEDEQRARVISRLTEENPATVAEIIQIWLSEDERKNGS
jgi:flagellar M-ring protein FliF